VRLPTEDDRTRGGFQVDFFSSKGGNMANIVFSGGLTPMGCQQMIIHLYADLISSAQVYAIYFIIVCIRYIPVSAGLELSSPSLFCR
jgi:hypothetical protein